MEIHWGHNSVTVWCISIVVFTDQSDCEAVFLAGGFKGESVPCSIIEKLSIKTEETWDKLSNISYSLAICIHFTVQAFMK